MRKIVLFLLATLVMASCAKNVKQALRYTVTNDVNDSTMRDIFIPDTGTYTMTVRVKFLSGFQSDPVKLVITGLPSNITVTPDTFSSELTFDKDFVFRSKNAPHGVYPITITGYTETVIPQSYTFNVNVIPADCAALFWGTINGRSTCTSRAYMTYASTGLSSGILNNLTINNFSGYGTNCNVTVLLNCDNDSLHIPLASYGNGVTLSGSGVFNKDSMVISYNATSIPTGGWESCTVIYKK